MHPAAVDLLHPTRQLRLDPSAIEQNLTFAFAAGGTGEALKRILDEQVLAPSTFVPESFSRDLFLGDFVRRCIPLKVPGGDEALDHELLERLLAAPPADPAVVHFRHQVLRELLGNRALRRSCESVWCQVQSLRRRLETADFGGPLDAVSRRVELLRATKGLLDELSGRFDGARSGLARLSAYAREVQATDAYRHLEELLEYEGHLATMEVRLRVGYDGRLRSCELVRAQDNTRNAFYRTRLSRVLTWLTGLLRGYRFREAEVLAGMLDGVFDGVRDVVAAFMQIGCDLEFYLAALAFRDFAGSRGLEVCLPRFVAEVDRPVSQLGNLFNPFLLLEPEPPIPCDLTVPQGALIIVSGPNSGGKTRLLQGYGLAQLLAQSGFFVPAEQARLAWREGLFVSLVYGNSCDEREGRLGTELLRIRRLFEQSSFESLVLLDELCAGTNPSEGEELFELVVTLLSRLEPQALISTHFLEFAHRLQRERTVDGLDFLQVELDEHLHPTYHFMPGVASTSLARQTAERLGVTRDALLGLIEAKHKRRSLDSGPDDGGAGRDAAGNDES